MSHEINIIEHAIDKITESTYSNQNQAIKKILEALLFSSSEALSLEKLREVMSHFFSVRIREIEMLLAELDRDYKIQGRAFQIDHIAGGYLLRTTSQMRPYIEQLHRNRRGEKLSPAATEVLAIIAFKSPITRKEIEKIRGVDCSGTVTALIERGLIEPVGRKESLGRPIQYGVTKKFLHYFGLNDLSVLVTEELTHSSN